MVTIHDKPRWIPIGQYRNIPLPIKPLPPPAKHFSYAKYLNITEVSVSKCKKLSDRNIIKIKSLTN
jgi:hypothetical protein